MKKSFSILVAILLLVSVPNNVVAFANDADPIPAIEVITYISESNEQPLNDVLRESIITPFGTGRPTQLWDLANKSYGATIEMMVSQSLYTNYYFVPNSDNKIHVSYNMKNECSTGTTMNIGIYDMVQKKVVASWVTEKMSYSAGATGAFSFINLVANRDYCVVFSPGDAPYEKPFFYGSATISH